MRKSLVRIVCFVLLLALVLSAANRVFKVKNDDGAYSVMNFYEQEKNSVDVLILGSSHAFASFNTGVLWDEHGMAAYILGGALQPMWNTYYYLKEALKTQKPELIVLEGFMTTLSEDYTDYSIINNTYGLKWSADKLAAIKVSTPQDQWRDYIPEYLQYHMRYAELSAGDFFKDRGDVYYKNWKGFWDAVLTKELANPEVINGNERRQLNEKTEKYYRMIIELAQENNIPIVVVVSPYPGINEESQAIYNRAQDIAAEYGVDFVNYNLCYQEMGIDYTMDAADESHLNHIGNRKFSRTVGQYLTEHYEISDRRGDERYRSWQDNADYIRSAMIDVELRNTADREAFLEKIQNGNYHFFISVDGACDIKNADIHHILNTFGISYGGTDQIWEADVNGVKWYSGEQEMERYLTIDRHDVGLKRVWNEEKGSYENKMIIDNTEYKKVDEGVNIIVYNTIAQEIVECVGFDADEDYELVR